MKFVQILYFNVKKFTLYGDFFSLFSRGISRGSFVEQSFKLDSAADGPPHHRSNYFYSSPSVLFNLVSCFISYFLYMLVIIWYVSTNLKYQVSWYISYNSCQYRIVQHQKNIFTQAYATWPLYLALSDIPS